MALTIGRVGLSTSGVALDDPESWQRQGSIHTLNGVAKSSSQADVMALTEQLRGLVDNQDEPFVSCTWDQESAFDGFYRVLGVQIGSTSVSLAAYWFPYSISLERLDTVAGYAGIESSLVGAVITNGGGVSTSQIWHASPSGVDYFPGSTSELGGYVSRSTETGAVNLAFRSTTGSGPWNLNARYSVSAADFYDGAAKIEAQIGASSAYRTVVGRTLKAGGAVRLNNGVIRYQLGSGIDVWNGSSWESVSQGFQLLADGSGGADDLLASNMLQILRNSPEEVAVRVTMAPPTTLDVVTVDYILRRGGFMVTGYIQSTRSYDFGFDLGVSSGATSTNTYIRNSDDGNGNRWFTTWAPAATANTGAGLHYINSAATSATFGIGVILNYATAVSPDSLAAVLSGFWGQLTERMTVVHR